MRNNPRQRNLKKRGAMRLRDLFERRAFAQVAFVHRRIGREEDVVLLAVFQHAVLDVRTIGKAERDLVCNDGRLGKRLRQFQQF